MNMNDQNFGEFLQTKRKQQKITLRQLAEKLGVSAPFLSDVEKGRRNSLDMDTRLVEEANQEHFVLVGNILMPIPLSE